SFFFSSRRRHTRSKRDWSSDVCSSDLALSKTRSVKSEALYLTTPASRQWCHIDTFFRRHRRLKWDTIRLATSGNKRKRMDFRVQIGRASCREKSVDVGGVGSIKKKDIL